MGQQIHCEIDEKAHVMARHHSVDTGMPLGEIISEALKAYLSPKKTLTRWEIVRRSKDVHLAQGQEGEGLDAYAHRHDIQPENLRRYRRAAELLNWRCPQGMTGAELSSKLEHLSEISRLRESPERQEALHRTLTSHWPLKEVRAFVRLQLGTV